MGCRLTAKCERAWACTPPTLVWIIVATICTLENVYFENQKKNLRAIQGRYFRTWIFRWWPSFFGEGGFQTLTRSHITFMNYQSAYSKYVPRNGPTLTRCAAGRERSNFCRPLSHCAVHLRKKEFRRSGTPSWDCNRILILLLILSWVSAQQTREAQSTVNKFSF